MRNLFANIWCAPPSPRPSPPFLLRSHCPSLPFFFDFSIIFHFDFTGRTPPKAVVEKALARNQLYDIQASADDSQAAAGKKDLKRQKTILLSQLFTVQEVISSVSKRRRRRQQLCGLGGSFDRDQASKRRRTDTHPFEFACPYSAVLDGLQNQDPAYKIYWLQVLSSLLHGNAAGGFGKEPAERFATVTDGTISDIVDALASTMVNAGGGTSYTGTGSDPDTVGWVIQCLAALMAGESSSRAPQSTLNECLVQLPSTRILGKDHH